MCELSEAKDVTYDRLSSWAVGEREGPQRKGGGPAALGSGTIPAKAQSMTLYAWELLAIVEKETRNRESIIPSDIVGIIYDDIVRLYIAMIHGHLCISFPDTRYTTEQSPLVIAVLLS